jgi:hypothetical protein
VREGAYFLLATTYANLVRLRLANTLPVTIRQRVAQFFWDNMPVLFGPKRRVYYLVALCIPCIARETNNEQENDNANDDRLQRHFLNTCEGNLTLLAILLGKGFLVDF